VKSKKRKRRQDEEKDEQSTSAVPFGDNHRCNDNASCKKRVLSLFQSLFLFKKHYLEVFKMVAARLAYIIITETSQ